MSDDPDISVVLPLRNRRATIAARVGEIAAALDGRAFEIVAVDDGSVDGTFAELRELAAGEPRLRVVRLRRPFGSAAALAAGFDRCRGAAVATIDADGETSAADIPRLLAALDDGYDVAGGRRPGPRTLQARLGNRLIAAALRLPLHDYGCPLKAYRADVVRDLQLYGGLYRLTPALASWQGARVTEVEVAERRPPHMAAGAALRRALQVLLDLLTVRFLIGYSARPMQSFGRIGAALLALAALLAVYLADVRLWFGQDIGERPLLLLATLLAILGAQFLALGLLGELLARVYYEAGRRPIYAVREELGAPAEPETDA